jgi:hypothetical protein
MLTRPVLASDSFRVPIVPAQKLTTPEDLQLYDSLVLHRTPYSDPILVGQKTYKKTHKIGKNTGFLTENKINNRSGFESNVTTSYNGDGYCQDHHPPS